MIYDYVPMRVDMPQVYRRNMSIDCFVMTVTGHEVMAHYNYTRNRWITNKGRALKDDAIAWRTA